MRALRPTMVATMTLALAGSLGGTALGEEPYPYVTGTLTYIEDVAEPSVGMAYGSEVIRDAYAIYDLAMSDPRVTGTYSTYGAAVDAHPNGVIAWSTPVHLDATTGRAWGGTISGTFHPEMGWQGTGWLAAEDPTDTGVFFLHMEGPDRDDGVWEVEGVIHDGCAWSETAGGVVFQTDVAHSAAGTECGPLERSSADVEYVPLPSIDPSLTPDADGFYFEEVAPGVRRLVTDGAGHFPSATYIREARDMDELAVDAEGRVLVWSTTHGIDNELGGDAQLWVLGTEGVLDPDQGPPRPSDEARSWGETTLRTAPDGVTWSLDWELSGGVIRSDGGTAERFLADHELGSLAITPDGRAWVAEGHDSGEAGGIYVIEPDAEGKPADVPAATVVGTMPSTTSGSNTVPVASVALVGEPFFVRATDEADSRRCSGLVVEADTVADGEFLPEAQCWDEGAVWWEDAAAFESGEASATADRAIELELDGRYRLDGVIVQADDNDAYLLSYRDPDSGAWRPLWSVPPAYAFGMITRPIPDDRTVMQALPGVATDAVRFAADFGDGMYSVSEIQLFGEPVDGAASPSEAVSVAPATIARW